MLNEVEQVWIERAVLCWLATSSADGMPSVSPKEIYAVHGDQIVIANVASPNSVRNIRANGRACVAFLDVFRQKGIQVFGQAEIIDSTDGRFDGLAAPLRAIAGDAFVFKTLFAITPQTVKPIIAPRYRFFPGTTEEDQVESAMQSYGVRPHVVEDPV